MRKFPRPEDIEEARKPLSTRVKASTHEVLAAEAEGAGIALSFLVANILDDYVKWLDSQPRKRKGR